MRAVADSVWALLVVGVFGLWAASRRSPRWVARPGELVAAVMANRAGRAVLLVAWMFAGWHFFAR